MVMRKKYRKTNNKKHKK